MLANYKKRSTRKPYKKYGARFGSRPWATYNPRRALWNPSDPYSDSFVHKFRRLAYPARVFAGVGNVPTLQADPSPTAQWTIGPPTSDSVAGLNLSQFGMTYSAHLDSVLNYTDMTSMFNEYKVDKVDILISLVNGPSGQPNVGSVLPELYVRFDPNDATMPGSFQDLAQSANTQVFNFSQKTSHHYSFVPKASIQVYAPGGGDGYGAPSHSSMWFDTAGYGNLIPMYGLKLWWRNFETTYGGAQIFQFQPTFFLSMRRPR